MQNINKWIITGESAKRIKEELRSVFMGTPNKDNAMRHEWEKEMQNNAKYTAVWR